MGRRIIIWVMILVLAGCAGTESMPREGAKVLPAVAASDGNRRPSVLYSSDGGQILKASFDSAAGAVDLVLPGGRPLRLPQGLSASGARYTDGHETFWEHHGEGSYWRGEKLIFRGTVKEESRPK